MIVFEFDTEIKNLKKCYHNNIVSKYVDLSDFTNNLKLIKVLNFLLNYGKLVRIIETNETQVLKIYSKPFLPKYFNDALKLTNYEKLVIKRNGYYKIKYTEIGKILNLPLTEVEKNLSSYQMFYGDKPFYIVDSLPVVFKYQFLATPELNKIFEEYKEQTVVDSDSSDSSDDLDDSDSSKTSNTPNNDFKLRPFQQKELDEMLNNETYYFANPPRTGTSYVIAAYVKRNPEERILIVVSRKTIEDKFKKLIKESNATIVVVNEFYKLENKYFDTIICDECQHDYMHIFEKSLVLKSKYSVMSTKQNYKTFFFSSTMPNDIDFNKFYEYTYEEAVNDGYIVKPVLNYETSNIHDYLKSTKSKHVLIVSDNYKDFNDSFIKIETNDTLNKRKEKIAYFEEKQNKTLVCLTAGLEGLDLPKCDEVILYKPNYKFTNIIQVCGRCLEATKTKRNSIITIYDKTNIHQLLQYFEARKYYDGNDEIIYRLRKNNNTFSYDYVSDFTFCVKLLQDILNNMDYFDISLIDKALINLFTQSENGKNFLSELLKETKFTNIERYIDLLTYNNEPRQMPKIMSNVLSKHAELTALENVYKINGFYYNSRLKPIFSTSRSETVKKDLRLMFYEKYGTSVLSDSDILFLNGKFYLWKKIKN